MHPIYRRVLRGLALVFVGVGMTASSSSAQASPKAFVSLCKGGACVDAPTQSAERAQVSIIAFYDFQCPFCSRSTDTLRRLTESYPTQLQITWMHNPLPFHKEARIAAIASMAAARQGAFSRMYDLLFDNQRSLTRDHLMGYAGRLGLDLTRFSSDLDAKELADFVDWSRAVSNAVGAAGTPAFLINGRMLKGAQPLMRFQELIDEEVEVAKKAGRHGDGWLRERTRLNNADLAAYLWDAKRPQEPAKKARKSSQPDMTVYKVTIDPRRDATKGDPKALVTLVVFAEYQCPFCKRLEPTLKELTAKYGSRLRLVFKHNPLPFHKHARGAAHAALCAKDQGKFWEMHELLFDNQRSLTLGDMEGYAKEVGLTLSSYRSCMKSERHMAQIDADIELSGKVTARGTPNTFINGRKLTGAKPIDEFEDAIEEELKKAKGLLSEKGVTRAKLYDRIIANGKTFEPLEPEVNSFKRSNTKRRGPAEAKIKVVVFSDFQCPFCSKVSAPLKGLQDHYGDKLSVTYKHFPLSFHKQARAAAEASECAAAQEKFWPYHDLLFERQQALGSEGVFIDIAKSVGLKVARFERCLGSSSVAAKVDADMAEARAVKVRGTPTIYINGRKFTSPSGYNVPAFVSVIDEYFPSP